MRRKIVPVKSEDEEKILSPIEEIEQCEYITDISDKIDSLVEQAKKTPKDERKVLLRKAQDLMDAYETYVGRKVYKPVL
jgi:hypothetical protein